MFSDLIAVSLISLVRSSTLSISSTTMSSIGSAFTGSVIGSVILTGSVVLTCSTSLTGSGTLNGSFFIVGVMMISSSEMSYQMVNNLSDSAPICWVEILQKYKSGNSYGIF